MKLLQVACAATFLLVAVEGGVQAVEPRRGSPGNVAASIENCISHDWIHFGERDQSAVLDDPDHRLVRAEMIRRYPVIAGDGFPSSRTLLWQPAAGELLYIAVVDNPAQPGQACFSATFAAHKFDVTLLLRRKYLASQPPDGRRALAPGHAAR